MHVLCMYVCTCTNLVLEEIRCKKQEARSLMKFLGRMTYETIAQARFPRLAHHLFRVRDQSTTLPHPSNYYSIAIASLCGMKRHCINQAVTDHPRCGTCWKEGEGTVDNDVTTCCDRGRPLQCFNRSTSVSRPSTKACSQAVTIRGCLFPENEESASS